MLFIKNKYLEVKTNNFIFFKKKKKKEEKFNLYTMKC